MKKIIFALLALVSLTLLIGCDTKEVTVSFVVNGGNAINDITVVQKSKINDPLATKDGYTFEGWYEDIELNNSFDLDSEILRNVTLYAKWSINSYSVTFISGNGSEDIVITDDYNTTIEVLDATERTGYVFGGWFLDEDGTDEFTSTRIPSEDTTLYAYWIQNQYTVNFYIDSTQAPTYTEEVLYGDDVANAPAIPVVTGMDGVWDKAITNITNDTDVYVEYTKQVFDITFKDFEENIYSTITLEYGDSITTASTPTRLGHDFIGYYSPANEVNIDFSTYVVTEDLVLIDNFQIQTFSVKFFGGEDGALIGTVQYIDYSSGALAPTEGIDRNGYTFAGWDVAFNNVTADLNIYAEYTINQYTASFDANGGVYTDGSGIINVNQDYNSNVSVPEVPSREDYVFEGWYLDLSFENEVYFGTGIPLPVDGLTVYAKWFDLSTTSYTVSGNYYFEEEGIATDELSHDGIFTQTSFESYTPFTNVAYNSEISAIRDIDGYEFYKYVYNGQDFFDQDQLTTITQDETIDVYYRRVVLTVSFSEEVSGVTVTTNHYIHYNNYLINIPTATPIVGHNFIGFYSQALERNIDLSTYTITEDLALVSNYEIQTFSVKFFGGEDGLLLGSVQTIAYGSSATAPTEGLDRAVYTFTGWDIAFNNITSDLEVHAEYTINQYNANFDANGGVYADLTDLITLNQDYNSNLTVPEVPTRTDFTFAGWYTDLSYEHEIYFGSGIPLPADGLTVYAKWFDLSGTDYTVSGTYYFEEEGIATDGLSLDGIFTQASYESYTPFANVIYNSEMSPVRDIEGYEFYKYVHNGQDYFDEAQLLTITQDETVDVYYRRVVLTVSFSEELSGETVTTNYYVYYNDHLTNVPTATPVTGYDFISYYSPVLEVSIDFSSYSITEDLALVYNFQIQTFSVKFYGGEEGLLLGSIQTIDYGSSATAPTEGLDRAVYTFTGWDIAFNNVTSDLDVHAEYTINQYNANFEANGGVYIDLSDLKTLTQDYNSNVTVPEVPTKAGFVFEGWYLDLAYENEVYFSTGIPMPVNGFTVYAKWQELVATTYTVSGTYFFEEQGIATDGLSLDGIYLITSSESYTPFMNIVYDTEMSPVRDIEGYEFYKFEYDGQVYFDESQLLTITQDETVDVYYRRIILTVSFTEYVGSVNVTTIFYVYYNDSLDNVAEPQPVTGMTVSWERQNFDNIKSNLSVTAIQYDNSLQTVIFSSNGTIIYIATNESILGAAIDPHAIVLTADSPLWSIQQEGYRFLGWFIAGTDTQVTEGIVYYDDAFFSLDNITTVEARWAELSSLNEATDIVLAVDVNVDTITVDFTVLPTDIDGVDVYPTDFTFIINGVYIQSSDVSSDTLFNYISKSGNVFTLTLTEADPYYDFFKEILMSADDNYETLKPGTHTIQIVSIGDDVNTLSSNPSDVYQYDVKSIYDDIPESSTVKSYYIIEDFGNDTLRYIFYSNLTYQFTGLDFEIVEGSNHITADGNKLTTTDTPGDFTFTITDESGTRTYQGLVVKDIRQFSAGTSYQNYLTEINATTDDDLFLANTIDYPYYVGANNGFYLDILIRDNNGAKISLDDVLLTYDFYMNGSTVALDETTLEDYVSIVGNVMYFTSAAIDSSFRIVVEPKYEATLMNMNAVEYNVVINDGHNAFTNADLKALYSDLNVNLINVHRDITAELNSNQMYSDGSPINDFARPDNNYQDAGNVYYRVYSGVDNDQITLEGNFMTIDGSNLGYINPDQDGYGTIGYAQGFDIISTQIGIFYYNVYETTPVNNNVFTMNNLRVIGNTTTPSVNYAGTEEEIYNQERLMSQNSGGILGVVVRNGKADLNNLIIGYTVIGVTTNAYGENTSEEALIVDLDYVSIYDSWANSIYLYAGSGVSIDNSNIGSSGGAAIHFEDTHIGSTGYDDPILILTETNEINNWISGQESWFKAYAMSSIALGLKSSINSAVDPLGKTIIQMVQNPVSGLDTEMINLVFLSLPMDGAVTLSDPLDSTSYSGASEVAFDITDGTGNTVLERDWNFTDSPDPRIGGGQYGFALGSLSETSAFIQMITDIMVAAGGAVDQATAGSLATIAAFYNLTAGESLQVAGYMGAGYSIPDAVIAVKGSLDYAQPQFIEVVAPLALTGAAGNATILIEMFNASDE
jgi:uncharacterized repeat protein (TIGR02543 family)